MRKRLHNVDRWREPFIKGLKTEYKLLLMYIKDQCDHAGVWIFEPDIAELRTGCSYDWDDVKEAFKGHVFQIEDGQRWFIYDFLEDQYGEFNENVRAHKSAIALLKKYKIHEISECQEKPLIKGLITVPNINTNTDSNINKKEDARANLNDEPIERELKLEQMRGERAANLKPPLSIVVNEMYLADQLEALSNKALKPRLKADGLKAISDTISKDDRFKNGYHKKPNWVFGRFEYYLNNPTKFVEYKTQNWLTIKAG